MMPNTDTDFSLDANCRMAFAAYLHDLGKFAERSRVFAEHQDLKSHETLYCPYVKDTNRHTHKHAAHTALALDAIEQNLPDLIKGDMAPFVSRSAGDLKTADSLLNAAAAHHKPETLLQWIVATADRVASGFERETFEQYNQADDEHGNQAGAKTHTNHYTARQLTLFENINKEMQSNDYAYPLATLTPASIFPKKVGELKPKNDDEAKAQYLALWNGFVKALKDIPTSHRSQWDLWLDHFDTLWQTYTHAIPSATAGDTRPDVSLYDHSKTTAALATALYQYHSQHKKMDDAARGRLQEGKWDQEEQHTEKFLLIQGDFFGIQDFIFASGAQTNKAAAKLLRGRSFYVSLLSELAALKLLQALNLPSTSQVTNAAGKFLIVAGNSDANIQNIKAVQKELNAWFLSHSFGQAGVGIAYQKASCADFIGGKFKETQKKLFAELDKVKLKRFGLCGTTQETAIFDAAYSDGACVYNGKIPADNAQGASKLSLDQIKIGQCLASPDKNRILVLNSAEAIQAGGSTEALSLTVFGYTIAFTKDEDITGRFGEQAKNGSLLRAWDISLPTDIEQSLWHGYARRYINAYVPTFKGELDYNSSRYKGNDREAYNDYATLKTLGDIACEDRHKNEDDKWIGQTALTTLKGDVDNLGAIFQQGLAEPTFAKIAALSRQMNNFFALYLPALCREQYPNTYTVFAGGDDFFLIGPWHSTQKLAKTMADEFKRYVAQNPKVHFSAGMITTKAGVPIYYLADQAEEALEAAKAHNPDKLEQAPKNAFSAYGITGTWQDYGKLGYAEEQLEEIGRVVGSKRKALPTSYIYALLQFCDMAGQVKINPEANMWRSRLAYRTHRMVYDNRAISDADKPIKLKELMIAFDRQGIDMFGQQYRIVLTNHLYQYRD